MEWLEFSRWSDEVMRDVAAQKGALECLKAEALAQTPTQKRELLDALLRSHPASNPWGHPVELC